MCGLTLRDVHVHSLNSISTVYQQLYADQKRSELRQCTESQTTSRTETGTSLRSVLWTKELVRMAMRHAPERIVAPVDAAAAAA